MICVRRLPRYETVQLDGMPWRAISYAPKALDCRTQAQYMCLLVQCVTLRPELGTRNEGGRQTQSTRNEGGRQTPRTQGQGRLNHLSEACPTSSRSTYLGRPGCSRQSSPGQTSQSRFDQARLTHGVDSIEQWLLCLAHCIVDALVAAPPAFCINISSEKGRQQTSKTTLNAY